MTGENGGRAFRRIVGKVPDWMVNAYEINKLLKEHAEHMKQLTAELGEHRAEAFDNQLAMKGAREMAEEIRATGMFKVQHSDGTVHYERVDQG